MPDQVGDGDDLARLRGDVAEADLLVFLDHRQMRVLAPRRLFQRLPCLDGDLAVGFGRQHQHHLAGVDRCFDLRHALGRPIDMRAVQRLR
jgi:hypothetical protein